MYHAPNQAAEHPLSQALSRGLEQRRQAVTTALRNSLRLPSDSPEVAAAALNQHMHSKGPESLDLVELTLLVAWPLQALAPIVREATRTLRPEGLFMCGSLGPGSLRTLLGGLGIDGSWLSQRLPDMHDLGDLLVRSGLSAPVMESEMLTLTYRQRGLCLSDLHGLLPRAGAPGLRGSATADLLSEALERARSADGRIQMPFELVFGHAWCGHAKPQPANPGGPIPIRITRPNRFS
ncbi:MAG: hypothetical protein EBT03_07595 [Betaproteobacteria bacterium]|nr:hypothetical protein [Betaproteobacteria bacterium]NBT75357.1 hypothetical protein [Betaproteobacteria bacterium]